MANDIWMWLLTYIKGESNDEERYDDLYMDDLRVHH